VSEDRCDETPRGGWTFNTLLAHVMSIMNERDRRYGDIATASKDAVGAALTAAKELVAAAFQSAEKAREKADAAQKAYDLSHNDLIRKNEVEMKYFVRVEKMDALADRVTKLEAVRELYGGRAMGLKDAWSIALAVLGAAALVWSFVRK